MPVLKRNREQESTEALPGQSASAQPSSAVPEAPSFGHYRIPMSFFSDGDGISFIPSFNVDPAIPDNGVASALGLDAGSLNAAIPGPTFTGPSIPFMNSGAPPIVPQALPSGGGFTQSTASIDDFYASLLNPLNGQPGLFDRLSNNGQADANNE